MIITGAVGIGILVLILAVVLLSMRVDALSARVDTLVGTVTSLAEIVTIHDDRLETHANQIPMFCELERAREIFEQNDALRRVVRKAAS